MASNSDQESLLKNEWKTFFSVLFKPLVICPILTTTIFLYFANTDTSTDKKFSILMNIAASITLGLAGGFLNDAYKNMTGNQLLIKKGLSAVRNLSLSRVKINNIAKRSKQASSEEMTNLLSMLEKDIANATQEWNDIIPGVTENIETSYILLKEKEEELSIALTDLESIKNEGASNTEQKEKLIEEQSRKITELQQLIKKLEIKTSSPVELMNLERSATMADLWNHNLDIAAENLYKRRFKCTKCGSLFDLTNFYQLSSDGKAECSDCRKKNNAEINI